jgi:hypothetical protein
VRFEARVPYAPGKPAVPWIVSNAIYRAPFVIEMPTFGRMSRFPLGLMQSGTRRKTPVRRRRSLLRAAR